MDKKIDLAILPQPSDWTCGPTSLQAVYNYYNDPIPLGQVIDEIDYLENGGTLAVNLAIHALKRGYEASICTYNLDLFDLTWFQDPAVNVAEKLTEQLKFKKGGRIRMATEAYLEFLRLGGRVFHKELTNDLLKRYLRESIPILTGLSATYLYQVVREFGSRQTSPDDLRGDPVGHFVVLTGFTTDTGEVLVSDPYQENPLSKNHLYSIPVQRLINAILLGAITYDANFLIIEPTK